MPAGRIDRARGDERALEAAMPQWSLLFYQMPTGSPATGGKKRSLVAAWPRAAARHYPNASAWFSPHISGTIQAGRKGLAVRLRVLGAVRQFSI